MTDRKRKSDFILVLLLCALRPTGCSPDISTEGFCAGEACRPKCRIFDPRHFGPDNKTIVYGDVRGRLGNQLIIYAVMWQLGRQLGSIS
jgi:hypothetical protein